MTMPPEAAETEAPSDDDYGALWARAGAAMAAQDKDEPPPEPEPEPKSEAASEPEADEPKSEAAVTVAERAKFRKERRELREAVAAEKAAVEAERKKVDELFADMKGAKDAIAAGDFETACKTAFGISAAEFNKRMAQRAAGRDPAVESLKERLERLEAEKQEAQSAAAKAREEAAAKEAEAAYAKSVGAELAKGPLPAAVVADPWFVDQVVAVQVEHWDEGDPMPPAEAAEIVKERLRAAYDRLRLLYEAQPPAPASTPESPARGGNPRENGAKAPKTISQRKAAEMTSASVELSEDEWLKKHTALAEAALRG